MSFERGPSAAVAAAPSMLRHKPLRRRLARDVRTAAPLLIVVVAVVLSAVAIVSVERVAPAPRLAWPGYLLPTMSSSSTSNVSAAPGGMAPGDPRSP